MLKEYIAKLVERKNLSVDEAQNAMEIIMGGKGDDAQIASFLTALRMKKESIEEITGLAKVMREKTEPVPLTKNMEFLDTCGTGGDGMNTFNISTIVAFIAAAAGLKVAKHGNRGVSSKCGSADILSALGVNINLSPENVSACLNEIGIGFLFAPVFHKAMKYVAGCRRSMGIRTVFNVLGPLTNPMGAKFQLMGVYDQDLIVPIAHVLGNLGSKHALVVNGEDGMDEVSLCAETRVAEYKNGEVHEFTIGPTDFGFEPCDISLLRGGSPQENAEIAKDVLIGANKDCPRRKVVLINASLALIAGNRADNIRNALVMAEECLDSGTALEKLKDLVEFTNSVCAASGNSV